MQFKLTYYVDDGYAGKDRPYYIRIYPEDFDGMTRPEIVGTLNEMIQEDFETTLFPYPGDGEIERILDELGV